jgi:hypothetical protein
MVATLTGAWKNSCTLERVEGRELGNTSNGSNDVMSGFRGALPHEEVTLVEPEPVVLYGERFWTILVIARDLDPMDYGLSCW